MPIEIVTVPCLSDNYAFLVHETESGHTALVDAPETAPVLKALAERGWALSEVWITHHHADHVQALGDILHQHPAKVRGASADRNRLPPVDMAHADGETFDFAGQTVQAMDVSGHTVGHIAYYMPQAAAVFTADSLMALGCGRLFEGTAEQMWASLNKLAKLPSDTKVFSGHEYTATNARFALTIEPDNEDLICRAREIDDARAKGEPTVPSTLAVEMATNPFLRAKSTAIRETLNMSTALDVEVFAEIRSRKDAF